MGNCKAYIIKGARGTPDNVEICYLKVLYTSLLETTGTVWFAKFILSKNRAQQIKEKCEKIDNSFTWIIQEVEMVVQKDI